MREVSGIKVIKSAKMNMLKTLIRWLLIFLHYVLVSVMIGNLADRFVFIPLENETFRVLDHGEEVGDQVGEDGASGPAGGCGGGVGNEAGGGGRV